MKILMLFIFFLLLHLLSFFFARHNSKSIRCMQILNIPNDCSANLLHSYLFRASCELRVMSYGLKTILALKHLSPAQNGFVPCTKSVCLLFGRWFRNPSKRTECKEKSFCKLHFSQGWAWIRCRNTVEMKERKKTTLHLLHIFCRCRVVLLHSFISALFLSFFQTHP